MPLLKQARRSMGTTKHAHEVFCTKLLLTLRYITMFVLQIQPFLVLYYVTYSNRIESNVEVNASPHVYILIALKKPIKHVLLS